MTLDELFDIIRKRNLEPIREELGEYGKKEIYYIDDKFWMIEDSTYGGLTKPCQVYQKICTLPTYYYTKEP